MSNLDFLPAGRIVNDPNWTCIDLKIGSRRYAYESAYYGHSMDGANLQGTGFKI
jgi:hypothetical protein